MSRPTPPSSGKAENPAMSVPSLHPAETTRLGHEARTVVHDLNNQLTAILGFSRILLEDIAADSPSRADVEQIASAAERAAQSAHQLLAIGRRLNAESGDRGPDTEATVEKAASQATACPGKSGTGAEAATAEDMETILVVEDEDALRKLAVRLLRPRGYEVLEARSASEALDLCRSHEGEIHMLMTDVVMPLMSGPELVQAATKIRPRAKVLYTTGFSHDIARERGVNIDEAEILTKPYGREDLVDKVRHILEGP